MAIESVSHFYGAGTFRRQILFDVTAEVRAGEIVIVTGPSGSGKTTLLTLLGGLRSTQEGSLRVMGQELRGADEATLVSVRRRIGYVFQDHNLLDCLTAEQNVRMALRGEALSGREARERAREMLRAVGLADRADHHPVQLSTGQRQRVAVARALAHRPRLILADEPTASLDRTSARDVVDLLLGLAREQGCTVTLVTHDARLLNVADRVFDLEDGRLSASMGTELASPRWVPGPDPWRAAREPAAGHRPADLASLAT